MVVTKKNLREIRMKSLIIHIVALIEDQNRNKQSIGWIVDTVIDLALGLGLRPTKEELIELINEIDADYQEAKKRCKDMKEEEGKEGDSPSTV